VREKLGRRSPIDNFLIQRGNSGLPAGGLSSRETRPGVIFPLPFPLSIPGSMLTPCHTAYENNGS